MVTVDDTRAQAGVVGQEDSMPAAYRTFVPSLPVSHPPYSEFHASWMQRLDQPYIYLEHYGSYAETGSILPVVIREMRIQGLEPSGAPFCLFYDDPGQKPADQLLSRACVPIADQRSPVTPLRYDVLPSRTVAYAYVSGAYPEVPRSYPFVFDYMKGRNFVIDGPIRETYIVPPSVAKASSDFLCEVQIPVTSGSR
jgi:effector-binding domain-containing protein